MRTKLDEFERRIESEAVEFRPVSKKQRAKVDGIIDRARKSRNINIRISEGDLARLKERSRAEGLPYQTLISSILHKYLSDRLVDEDAIRKSLELLQSHR